MGEPGGVGGETVLQAWTELRASRTPFLVVDDPGRLQRMSRGRIPVRTVVEPSEASRTFLEALPVLRYPLRAPVTPGESSPANADAVIGSVRRAVRLALEGQASGVVTNPVDKRALREGAGFGHAGHTSFLGELAGANAEPVMMLACDALRVVPVTVHIPLAEVASRISADDVVHACRTTYEALRREFGVPEPTLAVAGLNPHAGEGGMLGTDEARVITPALRRLERSGVRARGPYPADSLFRSGFRETYDAAICMYHDQALIPVKTLDFHGAVNVTLGLPFVRTSPAHGVAYDLAGTGRASPRSLIAAIRLAARLSAARQDP